MPPNCCLNKGGLHPASIGEDSRAVKSVLQKTLRHASFQITADAYVQAIPQAIRSAHSRVVEQLAAGINGEVEATPDPIGPRLDPRSAEAPVSCLFGGRCRI